MNFLNKTRFLIAMLSKASSTNYDLITFNSKKFFNNDKIIGWSNGNPSFSLYAPPQFSKPATNTFVTKIMSLYQWRKLPELVSIGITNKCNANCEYCSFTSMEKNEKVLSTDEYKKIIKQAEYLGVSTISIVGGEPLMQKDIVDIVQSVNKDKCQVMMFTNGWFLKEKAKDLKKAGLTTIIVSIDSADQAAHDKFKGKDGLFEKAVEGIKEAVKQKLLVGISSVIHKEDIDNGNLAKIIEMSKKLKINQNIVFEAIPVGNYSSKTDLSWTDEEREKLINYCDQYNNKKNYQGVYAYSYVKSYKSMGCSGGVIYFYVSPYGDVCPCDFNSLCVGNVKNEPLHVLWDKFNEKNSYCSTSLSGCRSQK